MTLEELEKRIRHEMWAVDTLAKTKKAKERAAVRKDALKTVLYWINQENA